VQKYPDQKSLHRKLIPEGASALWTPGVYALCRSKEHL